MANTLTDEQQRRVNFLKKNAEKKLYQYVGTNGGYEEEDHWSVDVAGDPNELSDEDIIAVYELVGFARVKTTRSFQKVG